MTIGCLWASEVLGWGTSSVIYLFHTLLPSLSRLIPKPTLTHLSLSLLHTQRVALAAHSVINTSLNITHQARVDLLDLAPVPSLRAAAVTLLNVWDALQKVDVRIFSSYISSVFSVFLNAYFHHLADRVCIIL